MHVEGYRFRKTKFHREKFVALTTVGGGRRTSMHRARSFSLLLKIGMLGKHEHILNPTTSSSRKIAVNKASICPDEEEDR
jgi:hypothetical protein